MGSPVSKTKRPEGKALKPAPLLCAFAFLAPLAGGPVSCSRGDDVQQGNFKEEVAKKRAGAQEGRIALESVAKAQPWAADQKAALDSIKNGSVEKSQDAVLKFLRGDAPREAKYHVVDTFSQKYSENNVALHFFYYRAALDFGMSFSSSVKEIAKEDPARLSYMHSLARGFINSGNAGFLASLKLVESMDTARKYFKLPILSGRENSLSAPFAMMVCKRLVVDDAKIDPKAAAAEITTYLKRDDLSMQTKSVFATLITIVDQSSLGALLKDPGFNEETKAIMQAVHDGSMRPGEGR